METVRYDEILENEALSRGRQMVSNGLYDRMGFSDGQRINKAKIGCIGELSFALLLDEKGITYETDTGGYANRNSDDFDFRINNSLIDIKVAKTSLLPNDKWTYGYPVQQINHRKDYVVVGAVNEEERIVRFYGWIKFSDIKKFPITNENTYANFKYSTSNYEFPWGALNKDLDKLWEIC